MSFLQSLEAELQKTVCLPREAMEEIDHFGFIQWKPRESDSPFPRLSSFRRTLWEPEDDAASEDAHTTEGEESEVEWFGDSEEPEGSPEFSDD
jgi:hypothetical protein